MTFFVDCKCRKCRGHFTGGDAEYDSWIAAPRAQPVQTPSDAGELEYRSWLPSCPVFPYGPHSTPARNNPPIRGVNGKTE